MSPLPVPVLASLAAALLAAGPLQSPFQEEHARSRQAREALAAGQPERALPAYEALEKELGPRPEVEAGRGTALLGLDRHAEARQAFEKARQAPEPLGSRALLGLGNALAGGNDLDGAIAATREALERDPGYADARYDLEVLLRRKAEAAGARQPRPDQQPDPSTRGDPGGGGGAGGKDGGSEAGSAPAPRPDAGKDQEKERQRAGAGAGPKEKKEERAAGGAPGSQLGREEAERLLDAMRARERNLPADPTRRKDVQSPDAAQDW